MNLGIIAHNSKKVLIEDFCIAYTVLQTWKAPRSRSQVSCRKYRRRQAVYGDGRKTGSGYGDPVL